MKLLKGLDTPLTGLDGKPMIDATGKSVPVGFVLANAIAGANSQEPARLLSLAMGIYNAKGEFKIANDDVILIKDLIQKDLTLNNFAKVAALEVLDKATDMEE